jgi:VIT1/CCC1 family predicted Fe2+/Mn2+ transporter
MAHHATPPAPPTPSSVERVKRWLADRLGRHYAAAAELVDRALVAFVSSFAAKALGGLLDIHQVASLSYWHTALLAGLAALVTFAQGLATAHFTGSPAALSLVSPTLRARRDYGRRVRHWVTVKR